MIKYLRNPGTFEKNIILVFLASSLANFLNLLYQLLIAHRLSPADFANFNALLSIFAVISTPLGTIQTATTKYVAEFNAVGKINTPQTLLSYLLKKTLIFALLTFVIFYFTSFYIIDKLKISTVSSGYILAVMLALSWLMPVFGGGLQGLELFKWSSGIGVATGLLKLGVALLFLQIGWGFSGALGAFLAANLAVILLSYFPLRHYLSFNAAQEKINSGEFIIYMAPLAVSLFCFAVLISSDMLLVKYFFTPQESGIYSIAQIAGKVFLFLPGAISVVMFPRTTGLNAQNLDTRATLKKSLLYAGILCLAASLFYNLFPGLVLKILTGKAMPESILLGRLFSISMVFFALMYIFVVYFLSLKDFRFIKYLVAFTTLQCLAIILFHSSLLQVQFILCINSIILFCIHALLLVCQDRRVLAY